MCNPTPAPVAPEFINVLQRNVEETLVACLRTMKAPEQVIDLVEQMSLLSLYLKAVETGTLRDPEMPFGIEEITIRCINLIAQCGGVFYDSESVSMPREITLPNSTKAEAEVILKDKSLTWEIVKAYLEENGMVMVDKADEYERLARMFPKRANSIRRMAKEIISKK